MIPIKKIQKWMKKNNYDIFLINRTDEFLNEYIAPYAERLKWISGFSGSAGRAIIELNKAYVFVDGRYKNQIDQEVDVNLFKIKPLEDYWTHLLQYKNKNKKIGLDPLLHSVKEIKKIQKIFTNSKIIIKYLEKNPIDICWTNQPPYPKSKAFIHDDKYAGESSQSKLNKVQKILLSSSIDFYLLSSLDSIAWLLNLRGGDIEYTPLLFSHIVIPKQGKIELFIDKSKIKHLIKNLSNIFNWHSFKSLDRYLLSIDLKKTIGFDEGSTSYHFEDIFNKRGIFSRHLENPCLYPKAIKNNIELQGARKANLRDGISVTRFIYWLKNRMEINETDEIKAADYLLHLRKKNDLFYSSSFDTISAFGFHAALPHYKLNSESNLPFTNNSIYLVDSGAQYRDGTTDITRTIVIGSPTDEQKDLFTRVLKGHIAIAQVEFAYNTKGSQLDPLARKALNEINCDYDHGTGHGIGSFLSVHEGPQRITKSHDQNNSYIKEGMIISNEPGYYKEGEFGIRIENLLICSKKNTNTLYFETISLAPIDVDLIEKKILSKSDIKWINNYHRKIYKKLSSSLNINEREWLHLVTKPI